MSTPDSFDDILVPIHTGETNVHEEMLLDYRKLNNSTFAP